MSGLVMMLVTVTWSPPTCLAMLPQKFSAATTEILPFAADLTPPEPLAQPATAGTSRTTTTVARTVLRRLRARAVRGSGASGRVTVSRLNESDSQYKVGFGPRARSRSAGSHGRRRWAHGAMA